MVVGFAHFVEGREFAFVSSVEHPAHSVFRTGDAGELAVATDVAVGRGETILVDYLIAGLGSVLYNVGQGVIFSQEAVELAHRSIVSGFGEVYGDFHHSGHHLALHRLAIEDLEDDFVATDFELSVAFQRSVIKGIDKLGVVGRDFGRLKLRSGNPR